MSLYKITKMLDDMNCNELSRLNRLVVATIREKSRELAKDFRVGDVVGFVGRHGMDIEGTIIKCNANKAIIHVGNVNAQTKVGMKWSVPYNMLSMVSSASKRKKA